MQHEVPGLDRSPSLATLRTAERSRAFTLLGSVLVVCTLSLAGCDAVDTGQAVDESAASPGAGEARTGGAEAAQPGKAEGARARAMLESPDGAVGGSVELVEQDGAVHIAAEVHGLEPGRHGFHIHEIGVCESPTYESAGSHFDPDGVEHGAPNASVHHAGDLGNLEAGSDGVATLRIERTELTLDESDRSALNRAVIVHARPDDLTSQPSGNAGDPVACGVIRPASERPTP